MGIDTASFEHLEQGVNANLATGVATSGSDTDTMSGIENLRGSAFADILTGDSGDNLLEGGAGADTLIGGTGVDTASYLHSDAGVTVDLMAGTGLGGDAQGDTLSGIENLIGSNFNDVLTGDSGSNTFTLGAGDDVAQGGAGNDIFMLQSGGGHDTLYGGTATTPDNGSWTDTIQLGDSHTGPVTTFTADNAQGSWILETENAYTIDANTQTLTFDQGDGAGTITMSDGSTVTFTDIDQIQWQS